MVKKAICRICDRNKRCNGIDRHRGEACKDYKKKQETEDKHIEPERSCRRDKSRSCEI